MMFLNGEMFGQGRMSVEEIVAKLDKGAGEREAAELSKKGAFDVLIVGGGPAGAAAAMYAARKGIRTGVVTDRIGGQVLDTLSIENFISVLETDGPKLCRLAGRARQALRSRHHEPAARAADRAGAGRTGRGATANGAVAEVEHRDPVDRRALARTSTCRASRSTRTTA
jgi:phytoene dehydrogenase-like protein